MEPIICRKREYHIDVLPAMQITSLAAVKMFGPE